MKYYIKLLRPKDWAKNMFLFIPSFFAGHFFLLQKIEILLAGFFAFCCMASSIYIINDYRDIENDRKHPVKSKRPLASGKVSARAAIVISGLLVLLGVFLAWLANPDGWFLVILGAYYIVNLAYCFGLKNIAILDMMIIALGFVLRVKGGAVIANVETSSWLIIMTFLLALFMAIGKRRDDVLLQDSSGASMRKSLSGYNLSFLDTMLGLFSAIIIVAYINYTVAPDSILRLGTYRLYYTSIFVIAGIMRYLQVVFVKKDSGSPTDILYKDRFIQITIVLWIACFFTILYLPHTPIFNK
ncbi:decaprenyl-phosphate phosphoribosyltransferase [Mucilaginibacter gotjawali]|uniref:4-hydroxybenzoate polyprenyltransferase n=2 Tax=Mucilaginibacter gotjawali TaxID=1550579 RepID=A0A839SG59_9SPHI|nr:decaprenyl-phosphate phosphoribosyltransferase [Mucilaginibacter gotjawali]MBB3056312.1 4-hydroxybenzoate polyprenyltransferase [Mucilaginibacter gotjawali]BAU55016.1 Decaprenyl-phosphate phosphoribosyltransferase [Mucilaginibacter gotjawali]